MKDKKYFIFLDVLRFLSFFLVFFYHFLVRIAENGLVSSEPVQKIYEHSNYHIATLGVSLFFMLSGAGLMLSAERAWDRRTFFRKRVIRILVPFYIAYAGIWVAMYIWKQGQIFEQNIPKWRFVFTLLGIDGYVREFGITTFSLGVGEWFLGCLVLMYWLFPLLRKLMVKNAGCFVAAATIVYLFMVFGEFGNIPVHMQFLVKLYEFVLGMYWAMQRENIGKKVSVFSGVVFFIFVMVPFNIPLKEGIKITLLAIVAVITASMLENKLKECHRLQKMLRIFCRYSFEMYLIHHWVIIFMTQFMAGWIKNPVALAGLFAAEMFVACLGGAVVKCIAHALGFCYNKLLKI